MASLYYWIKARGRKVAWVIALLLIVTSYWAWNSSDYNVEREYRVTFIDKSAPVDCYKGTCRANHTGLFRTDEGDFFERDISLYMFSQMHLGETFTWKLRPSDIKYEENRQTLTAVRYLLYNLTIGYILCLLFSMIWDGVWYCINSRDFSGRYSASDSEWDREKRHKELVVEFIRRSTLPKGSFTLKTQYVPGQYEYWDELYYHTVHGITPHPSIRTSSHRYAVEKQINEMKILSTSRRDRNL